jgi:transcriptional regulator with XRE-family HTH domain
LLELGKAIQVVRQAKKLRLASVAKAAGISVPFLSLVEGGRRQPSLQVLRRIADALDVPSEVLVLLGQSQSGSLSSSDARARELAESIAELMRAEEALRARLERKDAAKPTHGRRHRNRDGDG